MALINDQDASSLNIHNLDSRYKQYSATLNELRDPNNLSLTNSNITNGVESVNTNNGMSNVQQGVDLKEQLLNIISSNAQTDNLKQVTFNNVQTTPFDNNNDEFPLDEIKVTCQEMAPLHTLTTDISKTLITKHPFEPNFNFVEEGHFHREIPQAKEDNLKRVRNRLLLDKKDSIFFDITGEIKNDAPTLRHIPPFFLNDPSLRAPFQADRLTTVYAPASTWTIENSNVARHIRVEINRIRFTSHELSSDQDLLTNQLQTLYDSCMSDIQFPKTEYFVQKVHALREDLKHHPDREKELLEEIVECHHMRDVEENKMREKRDSLLECWHMLKEAREKSKPTTTICLRWKAKKINDQEKREEEILFNKDILERAKEIQRYKLLTEDENKGVDEIVNELKNDHEQMGLRMPGETKWIPLLTESPRADFNELSAHEQNRFKRLAKTKISIGFYMGVYEVLSDEVQLTSDFVALPDVGCHAIALHVPPSVKIHIFESGSSKRHELATVTLPVFNGEPPVFNEYEFTSSQPLPNGRMVQGFVEGRCFVETDNESLETIIKDTREEFIRKENIIDKVKKRPVHMSNKLMTELVNKHDPNDPYLTAAIATMKAHRYNETDDKSFNLDRQADSTLFASMAASDIWKQIPNRAFDLIRPTAENPYLRDTEYERLKLYDVVTQPPAATFSTFFKSIFNFFRRKKKSRTITAQEANVSHRIEERSTILLHIHQIFKIPLRYSEPETFAYTVGSSSNSKDTKPKQTKDKRQAKTREPTILVRISLQGVEHTSAVVNGQAADFNQQVELRLVKEGEVVPDYQQIEGKTIRIDIFDEYSKEELQFIGTLQIPLRSVFINGFISGTFSITSPHFTLDHAFSETLSKLSISICLRPRLIFDRQHLPCPVGECDEVNDRAHNYWNTLRSEHPDRNYSILVMTTEGKATLPCRMATKQSITEIKGFDELLAFVSMIPTNSTIDKHDKSAWSTSDEVIENNCGTNIEHALLYCNLLLGQNYKAYVVLGKDMISGYEAYVLVIDDPVTYYESDTYLQTEEEGDIKKSKKKTADQSKIVVDKEKLKLYNPTNGRYYKIDSEELTLTDVSTVFNHNNVYFNIQNSDKPISEMNWNFHNKESWLPFFDSSFKYIKLNTIQPTDLVIPSANEERVSYIKKKVKKIITETVESLRPQAGWFKQSSLKQCLKELLMARKEVDPANEDKSKSFNALMQDTLSKFNSFRIVGSPFFISYVYDDDANDGILRNEIFDEIKKREICSCYLSEDGKKETMETFYSFAVELKAFPNEIYAIWVLLVAIHPKQAISTSSRVGNEADEKKKKLNTSQSDYYYEEEEEEEEEEKAEFKYTKNNKKIPKIDSHDSIEIEEEESENESTKNSKSHISHHKSQNGSEKHKSQHNSTLNSPRNNKSQNENDKNKSQHNSALNSSRNNKSQNESEKLKSQHNSALNSSRNNKSQNESEKLKSQHNSTLNSPRDSINKSQNEKENEKSKQKNEDEQIIEEEEEDVSNPENAKPKSATPAKKEDETQKKSRKSKHRKGKKKGKDDDDDSISELSTHSSVIYSDSDSSDSENNNHRVSLGKILMLGEALEGSAAEENAKAATSDRSNKSNKSNRRDKIDDETIKSDSKSKSKISKKDSDDKDNLIKKKSNNDSDVEGTKKIIRKKKSQVDNDDDDEGKIYQISDISLSVPSPIVAKYSKRILGDSRMRKKIVIHSDSDDNNDSVYQMKKQASKKNNFGSDVQIDLKKKKQPPTRRRNRDDDTSPIKSYKKKRTLKNEANANDEVGNKQQKEQAAALLSSDSEK